MGWTAQFLRKGVHQPETCRSRAQIQRYNGSRCRKIRKNPQVITCYQLLFPLISHHRLLIAGWKCPFTAHVHRAALLISQPLPPGLWLDPGHPKGQLQGCPSLPHSRIPIDSQASRSEMLMDADECWIPPNFTAKIPDSLPGGWRNSICCLRKSASCRNA